jgi:hypothetical protein
VNYVPIAVVADRDRSGTPIALEESLAIRVVTRLGLPKQGPRKSQQTGENKDKGGSDRPARQSETGQSERSTGRQHENGYEDHVNVPESPGRVRIAART